MRSFRQKTLNPCVSQGSKSARSKLTVACHSPRLALPNAALLSRCLSLTWTDTVLFPRTEICIWLSVPSSTFDQPEPLQISKTRQPREQKLFGAFRVVPVSILVCFESIPMSERTNASSATFAVLSARMQ